MDPVELEYIGEKEEIGVIPNFNYDPIHLISGTVGKISIILKAIFNFFHFRALSSGSSSTHSIMVSNPS